MRRFALAAVLAGVVSLGLGPTADAQVVIGTRPAYAPGTVVSPGGVVSPGSVYTSGYYSPLPGYMYSPFANQPAFNGYNNSAYWNGYGWGGRGWGYYNGFHPGVRYSTYPSGGMLHASPYFHYYRGGY